METSALDSLTTWARRACGKAIGLREIDHDRTGDAMAFRLRAWPRLPEMLRVAPVYRLLSVMTVRPVSRHWMLVQSGLPARDIDALLAHLQAGGDLVQDAPAQPKARALAAG